MGHATLHAPAQRLEPGEEQGVAVTRAVAKPNLPCTASRPRRTSSPSTRSSWTRLPACAHSSPAAAGLICAMSPPTAAACAPAAAVAAASRPGAARARPPRRCSAHPRPGRAASATRRPAARSSPGRRFPAQRGAARAPVGGACRRWRSPCQFLPWSPYGHARPNRPRTRGRSDSTDSRRNAGAHTRGAGSRGGRRHTTVGPVTNRGRHLPADEGVPGSRRCRRVLTGDVGEEAGVAVDGRKGTARPAGRTSANPAFR